MSYYVKDQVIKCADYTKQFIFKNTQPNSFSFTVIKIRNDYTPLVNMYMPPVLTNIIIDYANDMHDVKCTCTKQSYHNQFVSYSLYIENKELDIDTIFTMSIKQTLISIDVVHIINGKYYDVLGSACGHICFVNYILSQCGLQQLKHDCIVNNIISPRYTNKCDVLISSKNHTDLPFLIALIGELYNAIHLHTIDSFIDHKKN